MNYRHAFHAGNFSDVFKHALLTRILLYLTQKPAPLFYLDTHAGAALYNLDSEPARRSPEWRDGIARLAAAKLPDDAADLVAPYFAIALEGQREGALTSYPGSPVFAQRLTRPADRLVLCELHPDEAEAARENLGRDRRVRVQDGDGYQALKALLPPPERRGLILIDPPYESLDEWANIAAAVNLALQKWPTGAYALWYPVKQGNEGKALAGLLDKAAIKNLLCLELLVAPPNMAGKHDRKGLAGCGLLVINPPFALAAEAEIILPALCAVLGSSEASWRADWLVQT